MVKYSNTKRERLTVQQADTQRQFYEAVRGGMDYEDAGEKFLVEPCIKALNENWERFKRNKNSLQPIRESTQEKRLYELDSDNLTITEVTE